jgi:hypothetical protein
VIICFDSVLLISLISEARVVVFQLQTEPVISTRPFFFLVNSRIVSGSHKVSNSGISVLIGLKTIPYQSF